MKEERLDKILVSQSIGSRREVQKLIRCGEVTVNGEIIKKPEYKCSPEASVISVDGRTLEYSEHIYIMLNKPAGVVSATADKYDKTVLDLVPKEMYRKGLFPAGRLDKDTEGLLIITDDGDFAHRMLSPTKHVQKQYIAHLDCEITDETIKRFEEGIVFADGTRCLPAKLEISPEGNRMIGIVRICEGKFHQVKKMFLSCGIKVVQLSRISIGNLYLDSKLPIGCCKLLTNLEKELVFIGNIH